MADPIFGISIRKIDNEPRPAIGADLSTIGLIGPAPGADTEKFPLNTPVLIHSNDVFLAGALGSLGYLGDAVRGINDQLAETQFAARIIIVRTAEGTDADPAVKTQQTINNITGSVLNGTGIHAFMKAVQLYGFTPRVICAPGYTGQLANSVDVVSRVSGGAGYIEGQKYALTFTAGGPSAVQAEGYAYGRSDGTLGPAVLDTPGAWYTAPPTVTAETPRKFPIGVVITAAGTGHAIGDKIGLASGIVLSVTGIGAGGSVTAVEVADVGPGITGANPANPMAQTSSSGVGTGATFTVTWTTATAATYTATVATGANPIVASLTGLLNKLMGVAVVESTGSSYVNDLEWRETFQSERLIPLSGGVKVTDPVTGAVVVRPFAPRFAGMLVAVDHEKGAPFHSAANRPVQGIVGPSRNISYALTDDANEAQELLRANIGVLVRGEIGDDFAIASAGFVAIATDTAAEDPLWQMYNVRRGRDFIHLTLLRALRFYLGRYNIIGHTVQATVNTMRGVLRDLHADGHILGYRVNFRAEGNSPEQIRLGRLAIGFAAEEPPVLKHLTIESARMRDAIDAMVADLASQLNLGA
jgi:phage tail sheath protein FI